MFGNRVLVIDRECSRWVSRFPERDELCHNEYKGIDRPSQSLYEELKEGVCPC